MSRVSDRLRFEKKGTDLGAYWMSSAPRPALLNYLQDCNLGQFKLAEVGADDEESFEQAFSSLAYSYLKSKAPRLLDYIIGFQLIDRNEDNTKAAGVFGFKVGDQWLYAPVFFLNGDLKGHELLYIKKEDAFVPLKENWINYLIGRKSHQLGEGSSQNTFELGGLMPNLMRLSKQPGGTKYGTDGAAMPIPIASWAQPALPMMAALMTRKARGLYPEIKSAADLDFKQVTARPFEAAFAPVADHFDLKTFLEPFPLLKLAFERCYLAYPAIKLGFDRFYGPDFFKQMGERARLAADSLIKPASDHYVMPPVKTVNHSGGRLRKAKAPFSILDTPDEDKSNELKKAELTVIALDIDNDVTITENKEELTDAEREKLLKDTVLIKDKRDPHGPNTSVAYNTQVRMELFNPSETGIYNVLEKPGTFDEMVVICAPHTGRGRENFTLVLRKGSPRNWMNTNRHHLWVKATEGQSEWKPFRSEYKAYVDKLPSAKDLQKGATYVALGEDGSGTCPFRIKEDYGDGLYRVQWKDHARFGYHTTGGYHSTIWNRPQDWEVGYSSWDARIQINERKGSKLRSLNGELSIPDSYKVIKVEDPPKPKKRDEDGLLLCSPSCDENDGDSSDGEPIQPGNLIDIQLMLHKTAQVIKLHDTGASEVWIKAQGHQERMTKKAALISLVRDHGLREDQARQMLKEASACSHANQACTFFVKYGAGYGGNLFPGPDAPPMPPPEVGVEQHGPNATPATYPDEQFQPVDSMSSQLTDPSIYDPFYVPDQHAMQQAQQAASSGQKEVFDTSMIGGLLKSINSTGPAEKYLGDFMKSLNSLGRLIFSFHYHQDEFSERYSKSDLPELEDSLRNTFESLGELTLFLLRRDVRGQSGALGGIGGSSGKDDPSGPSLDASSKD